MMKIFQELDPELIRTVNIFYLNLIVSLKIRDSFYRRMYFSGTVDGDPNKGISRGGVTPLGMSNSKFCNTSSIKLISLMVFFYF